MAKELTPTDVTDTPGLLELAEEVRRSGRARILRHADEDLAVLSPVTTPGKRSGKRPGKRLRTEADRAAFLSSAGGWAGNVDVDKFLEDNYASRSRSSRPPVEL